MSYSSSQSSLFSAGFELKSAEHSNSPEEPREQASRRRRPGCEDVKEHRVAQDWMTQVEKRG